MEFDPTVVHPLRAERINKLRKLMLDAPKDEPETRAAFAKLLSAYVNFEINFDTVAPHSVKQ